VQEHERSALRQQRPEIVVHRVVEVARSAPAADHDAGHPELVERAAGLLDGTGPPDRDGAEREQAVRGVGDVRCELVVAVSDRPPREAAVQRRRADQERRQGHDVVPDTDLVHLAQPDVDVVLRARQRERRARPHATDVRVEPHHAVGDSGEVGEPVVGQPLQERERHRVRVYVDRAPLGSGDGRVSGV
jgi:hypothetical protein